MVLCLHGVLWKKVGFKEKVEKLLMLYQKVVLTPICFNGLTFKATDGRLKKIGFLSVFP